MARPRKENLSYFPHDVDAANDEKVEAIRELFGNDGYAFYFILLERAYRTGNGEVDISSDIKRRCIAAKVGATEGRFDEMLEAAFEIGLFSKADYEDRAVITSPGIKRRVGEVQALREKWRRKKVFPEENPIENTEKTGEIKGNIKTKIESSIKTHRSTRFEPPSIDEVRAYCSERANGIDPQTFLDFYTANGWKQGKDKPIVDWKAAIRTWERRDQKPQEKDRYIDVV